MHMFCNGVKGHNFGFSFQFMPHTAHWFYVYFNGCCLYPFHMNYPPWFLLPNSQLYAWPDTWNFFRKRATIVCHKSDLISLTFFPENTPVIKKTCAQLFNIEGYTHEITHSTLQALFYAMTGMVYFSNELYGYLMDVSMNLMDVFLDEIFLLWIKGSRKRQGRRTNVFGHEGRNKIIQFSVHFNANFDEFNHFSHTRHLLLGGKQAFFAWTNETSKHSPAAPCEYFWHTSTSKIWPNNWWLGN